MEVYEPREDSLLLAKIVGGIARGIVLDVGTGTGIQALTACQQAINVFATDINLNALRVAKQNAERVGAKICFLCSNLFSSFKNIKFDTIIFNPPYLPEDKDVKDVALDGGKEGFELIERFLIEAKDFLKDDGQILIVFSSLTKKEKVDEIIKREGYVSKELARQKLDFEELYVYGLSLKANVF